MGISVWAFERMPSSSSQVEQEYLGKVQEADIFVLLLAGETTTPVDKEIAEALAARCRLLVFVLPGPVQSENTQHILNSLKDTVRYSTVSNLQEFGATLRASLLDELARALRAEPTWDRSAVLAALVRESRARCASRWRALGIDRERAIALANDGLVGTPPEGWYPDNNRPLVTIVGGFGAGKSLALDRMFQKSITDAQHSATPVPVLLRATDVTQPLKAVVIAMTALLGDPRLYGARVFIDGLDEVDLSLVARLIFDTRILVEAWPQTYVVLTSRPLPGDPFGEDRIDVPPLGDKEALNLIGQFADRKVSATEWHQTPLPLREAVRRPVFAVLMGIHMADVDRVKADKGVPALPQSSGALIAGLVDRALKSTLAHHPSMGEAETRLSLERFAVAVMTQPGGVPIADVRSNEKLTLVLESGLVAEEHRRLTFPLPILTHWFAAHALARGEPSVQQVLEAGNAWRWRYALGVAVGAFGSTVTDAILSVLARHNPALAGLVVSEGMPGQGTATPAQFDVLALGARVRNAMSSWMEGLGALSEQIAPIAVDRKLAPLGIAAVDGRIYTAWRVAGNDFTPVVPLPQEGHPFGRGQESREWNMGAMSVLEDIDTWPWQSTFQRLVGNLKWLLKRRRLPPQSGPLEEEVCWEAALAVLRGGSLSPGPIDLNLLQHAIARFGPGRPMTLHGASGEHDIDRLEIAIAKLRSAGVAEWSRARPGPDEKALGGWIWSGYSDTQLVALVRFVYENATTAYRQLVDRWFPNFAPFLHHYQILPARFEGRVFPAHRGPDVTGEPIMNLVVEPIPRGTASVFDFALGSPESQPLWFQDREDEHVRTQALRPEAADWLFPVRIQTSLSRFFQSDPIRSVVYGWLLDDLKRLGWTSV